MQKYIQINKNEEHELKQIKYPITILFSEKEFNAFEQYKHKHGIKQDNDAVLHLLGVI